MNKNNKADIAAEAACVAGDRLMEAVKRYFEAMAARDAAFQNGATREEQLEELGELIMESTERLSNPQPR